MNPKLPSAIQNSIDAANAHDVDAIAACFAADAVVPDEQEVPRFGDTDLA